MNFNGEWHWDARAKLWDKSRTNKCAELNAEGASLCHENKSSIEYA